MLFLAAKDVSVASAGAISSAPGTYSAPAGMRKSSCVSTSKKMLFMAETRYGGCLSARPIGR